MALNDPKPRIKVKPLFDAEYLRNCTKEALLQWNADKKSYAIYRMVSFPMTLNNR